MHRECGVMEGKEKQFQISVIGSLWNDAERLKGFGMEQQEHHWRPE